jgi:hypothetical protein
MISYRDLSYCCEIGDSMNTIDIYEPEEFERKLKQLNALCDSMSNWSETRAAKDHEDELEVGSLQETSITKESWAEALATISSSLGRPWTNSYFLCLATMSC